MRKTYLVSGKRTPVGDILGSISDLSAVQLGTETVKEILKNTQVNPRDISEVIMGNVLSCGLKQNPARQVSLDSGIHESVPCWNVNKVCASGMKTISLGTTNIMCGLSDIVIAGGFESMSNAPHFIKRGRKGIKFGHFTTFDSIMYDALTDVYDNFAMGYCAEKTAKDFKLSRKDVDNYCINSYERAIATQASGGFLNEMIPIKTRKGIINRDQAPMKFNKEKLQKLRPVFTDKNNYGILTGGNCSKLSDGACSFLLMSEEAIIKNNYKPLAEVLSFADAEVKPLDFNTSPYYAAKNALKRANLSVEDISYWEINEAFSVTPLANMKLLGIKDDIVNVHGGAVSLGHPLGMSGARITLSLISVLKAKNGIYGCASICNGGGGSSAIILKNLKSN